MPLQLIRIDVIIMGNDHALDFNTTSAEPTGAGVRFIVLLWSGVTDRARATGIRSPMILFGLASRNDH